MSCFERGYCTGALHVVTQVINLYLCILHSILGIAIKYHTNITIFHLSSGRCKTAQARHKRNHDTAEFGFAQYLPYIDYTC